MIKLNICLSKIDKSRIKESGGKKYLDLIVMDSRNDKYGNDYMVVEDVSKADREAGRKGNIIGNGKNLGGARSSSSSSTPASSSSRPAPSSDDIPF